MSALTRSSSFSNYSEEALSIYLQSSNFDLPQSALTSLSSYRIEVPEELRQRVADAYIRTPLTQTTPSTTPSRQFSQPLLGTLTLNANSVISDISGTVRAAFDLGNKVFNTPSPAGLAALGVTSGFNVVSGSLNVWNGIKEVKTADKTSDTAGKAIGVAAVGRGTVFATGGAIYVPVRALTIAALLTSSKIAGTMAAVLGKVATSLFGLGYVFVGASLGVRLHEHRQFRQQLFAILNDTALDEPARAIKALEHLKQLVMITSEEKSKIGQELEADENYRALTPEQKLQRRDEKENVLIQKKEASLKRVLDNNCLTLIRQKGPNEAAEVIAAVKKKSLEKTILASASMTLAAASLTLSIASFFVTAPIAVVTLAAVGLATSLGWLGVDTYGMIQEFINSEPGRFDKMWIFFSSMIATIALAVSVLVTGGLSLALGAGVIGISWIGINAVCLRRLEQLAAKRAQTLQIN